MGHSIDITILIVIERLEKSWWHGIFPGLCQTNLFYYRRFEHQSIFAALQNFTEELFYDSFYFTLH